MSDGTDGEANNDNKSCKEKLDGLVLSLECTYERLGWLYVTEQGTKCGEEKLKVDISKMLCIIVEGEKLTSIGKFEREEGTGCVLDYVRTMSDRKGKTLLLNLTWVETYTLLEHRSRHIPYIEFPNQEK